MNPKPTSRVTQVKTNIQVKVLTRSSKDQIIGKEGNVLKVKLTAPPVDGKANKALIDLLARRLGVSKTKIEIISGRRSRLKSLLIHGLTLEKITQLLKS